MESFQLTITSLLCFLALLSACQADLPSACLSDLISSSAGRCCSPHTFIEIEFTLGFGCDVPDRIDQGVRFEVERGREVWEPIRFYTPTRNVSNGSLVEFNDTEGHFVLAEALDDVYRFPVHYIDGSVGPVRIKEYLCGNEFAHDKVRLRWMQRYSEPSIENVSTWWLDDIRVSRWDGSRLTTVMESNFSDDNTSSYEDFNIRTGVIEDPPCAAPSDSGAALYFRSRSPALVPRRSLVIKQFTLNCTNGSCPPPVGLMRDSECSVTSCGAADVRCSLPAGASPFQCTACPAGFSTGNDSLSVACVDENECELTTDNCTGRAKCVNTIGGFYCTCPPGYQLSEDNSCIDIDECYSNSEHNCSHICNNTEGAFTCSCPEGYLLEEGVTCTIAGVGFELTSYAVQEGQQGSLNILLFGNISQPLRVQVVTKDVDATSTRDYSPLNMTLTFRPGGERLLTVTLQAMVDDIAELVERFMVTLTQPSLGLMITQGNVTVDIIDSKDVAVEFDPVSYSVMEGQDVSFKIVKKTNSTREVTVYFSVRNNRSNVSTNRSVMFSPNEAVHLVNISTIDNDVLENDGQLTAVLEGQEGVVILNSRATATVQDNDEVIISFNLTAHEVTEGSSVTVLVELMGETDIEVIVNLTSRDLTAVATEDYAIESYNLIFSNEVKSHNVSIKTVDDNVFEEDEVFQIIFSPSATNSWSDRIILTGTTEFNITIINNDGNLESMLDNLQSVSPSDASDSLSNFLDSLIDSGKRISSNLGKQFLRASQDILQNITGSGSDDMRRVGARVLANLDRFALRAFNDMEQPELKIEGLSLRVQEFESPPSNESTVVGIDQDGSEIQLPLEIFKRVGQTVRVASFIFTNLANALTSQSEDSNETIIASPIISTALGCGRRGNKCPKLATSDLSKPVRIVLPIDQQIDSSKNVSCQFLNLEKNIWSDEGCSRVDSESTDTSIVCECDHLTHFAILLSPKLDVSDDHKVALQIIGYVGVSISVVCMVITIAALVALRTLWGMRNYIHINLCVCLIVSQLVFVFGVDKTQNQNGCTAIAVILHYCFLAAFMWMLMEGVVLYVALVRVFIKKQSLYIAGFTIISYGVPLLYMLVTVPLGLVLRGEDGNNHYGSSQACWLRYDTHFVWAFIIPIILIILANIGFFIMAVYIMYKHQRRGVHKSVVKNVKHWLKTTIALLFVMGITWIIGVAVFHEALLFVAYIFTIFVAFQGTIIFVMFILLSKQVRENYKKWWRGKVAESDFLSKHFSSSESSGKRGLGHFSSLRTSSFRLSRNRSTFHSSHIDTDIKLPDEHQDSHKDMISPEIRMEQYMKERKYALGESVAETSEHYTDEPNGKLALEELIAKTTECTPNGHNGVTSTVKEILQDDHQGTNVDHPLPASEDLSSAPETLVAAVDCSVSYGMGQELRPSTSDSPQSESRQETEEISAL